MAYVTPQPPPDRCTYLSPEKRAKKDMMTISVDKTQAVRLLLCGRVFDVAGKTCARIPRLNDTLYEHESVDPPDSGINPIKSAEDKTYLPRKPAMQCWTSDPLANDSHNSIQYLPPKKEQSQRNCRAADSVLKSPQDRKTPDTCVVDDCDSDSKDPFSSGTDPAQGVVLRFQRNPVIFESIMDFVENGELHMPLSVCPNLFVRDLLFWGFQTSDLEMCCYPKLVSFVEEQKLVKTFHQAFATSFEVADEACGTSGPSVSCWQRLRQSAWLVMTDPLSSLLAKVYFAMLCLFVLLSFFVMAASTTTIFTRRLNLGEWKDFLGDDFNNYESGFYYEHEDENDRADLSSTNPNPKGQHNPRALLYWVECLSFVSTAFLSLDFVLRLLVCPSLRRFVTDFINVCDAVALVAVYTKYIIDHHLPEERYESSLTDGINALQLFRLLRFLGPMSKMRGFRVIYFTLKSSVLELLLLLALLGFLVMIFSSLLYYLGDKESMKSIPVAMWYALVTMTTVGYGDVVPNTFATKLIGCVCTVMGVIFLAMTLPIVVNNFMSLYTSCSITPPLKQKPKNTKTTK